MSLLERVLPDNPVLTKELRVRMRGTRAYWIMLGYLGFLAFVMLVTYAGWLHRVGMGGSSSAAQLGNEIYGSIYLTQIFLVLFITPAITSGALTIEREQRTIEMLSMTRMPSRNIVAGKLLSAVAFTSLLLITSLPLVSLCFTLGSVDPIVVARSYMMLLSASLLIGAMGLMWSSIAKTTTQAVTYTYVTLAAMFFCGSAGLGFSQDKNSGDIVSNALRAVGVSWFGEPTRNTLAISNLGFPVMCGLLAWIMCAIAMTRLEMWPERKGWLLRGLTAITLGVQLLLANRWWLHAWYERSDASIQVQIQRPISLLFIPTVLLMLLVPIFATGEFEPHELRNLRKTLLSGWSRNGLKRGVLASGTPFLLLLTAFSLGIFLLSCVLFGKPSEVTALEFGSLSLTLLASVFGFGMFCQFLSALLRNRWAAWMFGTLSLGMLWIAPFLGMTMGNEAFRPSSLAITLFYFNPAMAVYEVAAGFSQGWNELELRPMWPITTGAWLLVGYLSLGATRGLAAFAERRKQAVGVAA